MLLVSLVSMVAVSVASLLGIVCGPMENLDCVKVKVEVLRICNKIDE